MFVKKFLALAVLGLQVNSISAAPIEQNTVIDFNALLDGTLGTMPAKLLVAHGLLGALNGTATLARRSETSSISASATTTPDRSKENGAVVGSLIGAALLAPLKIEDAGRLKGMPDARCWRHWYGFCGCRSRGRQRHVSYQLNL
jgi:hypothetical protein